MKKMPSKNIRRTKKNNKKPRKKQKPQKTNNKLYILDGLPIDKISKETGFCQRKSKKINAKSFLLSFFLMINASKITFSKWAMEVNKITKKSVSKQAMWKRMTPEAVDFVQEVLKKAILKHFEERQLNMRGLFAFFNNVYLHDSTHIRLSDKFHKYFPAYDSKKHKAIAIVKIETIYNCAKGVFSFFGLRSFSNNDRSLSATVLSLLREKDLHIRDLGFFKLEFLKETMEKKAYFLTRKPFGLNIFDAQTGEPISLIKVLKKIGFIDKWVLVGNEQKLPVRLVALRVPDNIANERILKAKNNRDKRLNHSKEYYSLLHYEIFLTNVPQEIWTAKQVMEAYGLRWRIEIIFKSWKSYFNIQKLIYEQCHTKTRLECVIYLMLFYIALFQVKWYEYYRLLVLEKYNKHISLLKMTELIIDYIDLIICGGITEKQLILIIKSHAIYERRKDRVNTMEIYYSMTA